MTQRLLAKILLEAASKQGWRNDEDISKGLGVSIGTPSLWRNEKRLPSPLTMWKICEIAGYDPRQGVVELLAKQSAGTDFEPGFVDWAEEMRPK